MTIHNVNKALGDRTLETLKGLIEDVGIQLTLQGLAVLSVRASEEAHSEARETAWNTIATRALEARQAAEKANL